MQGRSLEDYVDVATRLAQYAEKYPEASLAAVILEDDGKRVLIRATASAPIFNAAGDVVATRIGTGHAEEIRGSGPVNKTSAVENAETSAWGRALAALGFETRNGIASKEEMLKVQRMEAVAPVAHLKTLTKAQADALTIRLADADPKRVQLLLTSFGATDLTGITMSQGKELLLQASA